MPQTPKNKKPYTVKINLLMKERRLKFKKMEKKKNKNKEFAFVTLVGTIVYSDVVRYDNNQKELHNYFIQVTEKYKDKDDNEKERKHSFKATQFGLKRNSEIFVKGDKVKINGVLKVNSYLNDYDEWVNQTYIMINKIRLCEN